LYIRLTPLSTRGALPSITSVRKLFQLSSRRNSN